MKQCIGSYIDPLVLLINPSIAQGVFPAELNIARVIPLYKGENNQLIHNYRPISVLPFFSKIFEKIVYKYVIDFFLMIIIFCMIISLPLENIILPAMQ